MLNTYIYHQLPPTCFGVHSQSSGRPLHYFLKKYMLSCCINFEQFIFGVLIVVNYLCFLSIDYFEALHTVRSCIQSLLFIPNK